jgi:hypothetical protein
MVSHCDFFYGQITRISLLTFPQSEHKTEDISEGHWGSAAICIPVLRGPCEAQLLEGTLGVGGALLKAGTL